MSSVLCAVILIPPKVARIAIASAASSVDVTLTAPAPIISMFSVLPAIISIPPAVALSTIASAESSVDLILIAPPPVTSISSVLPAIISIPPSVALRTIASVTFSVDVMLTLDPVAVTLISSPPTAPVAVISIPPALAVRTTAEAPSFELARFSSPVVSRSTPVVPELITIPPDALFAWILIAAASASLDTTLTLDPVALILISSPPAASVAVMSIPPALAVSTTAEAPFFELARFSSPVVSRSTPAVPEFMLMPPAALLANILTARALATPALSVIAPTSAVTWTAAASSCTEVPASE